MMTLMMMLMLLLMMMMTCGCKKALNSTIGGVHSLRSDISPPHPPSQPCDEGCRAGAPSSPWPSPRKPATLRASTLDDALAALIVRRLRRPLRVHPGVRGVDLALMLVSPRAPRRQPRDRPSISHRICAVEPEANSKRNRDPGPTSTCVREPRGGPQRVWMHCAHPRGHPRARGKKGGGQPFALRQAPPLAGQRRCKLRRRKKRTRSRKHPRIRSRTRDWYGMCCGGRTARPISDRGHAVLSPRVGPGLLVARTDRSDNPRVTTTTTTTTKSQSLTNVPWSLVSLVNHRPGTYDDDDTDKVASPAGGMLDAVPSASGPPRPANRSFVLSVRLGLTPEKRSRAAADMGRTGIPSEPLQPIAGTVPHDSSDIVRIASPRLGEIIRGIRCQDVHCDIVHRVGSDPTILF